MYSYMENWLLESEFVLAMVYLMWGITLLPYDLQLPSPGERQVLIPFQ